MSEDDRFAPKAPPHWTAPQQPPSGVHSHPQDTPLNRFQQSPAFCRSIHVNFD